MAGVGDVMMAELRAKGELNTEALAAAAKCDVQKAYSRLSFLWRQEGRVERVSGRGPASVWKIGSGVPAPAASAPPAAEPEPCVPATLNGTFGRGDRGWKPSHAGLEALDGAAAKGDRLLVEYPERWRHSAVAVLVREPSDDGVALCWDLFGKCYCYVDTVGFAARGWKVSRVRTEKQSAAILGVKAEP